MSRAGQEVDGAEQGGAREVGGAEQGGAGGG